MQYDVKKAIPILKNTPLVVSNLLHHLDEAWIKTNEGEDTWSPFDIVGHLIHGEKTDWIPRAKIILSQSGEPFTPFDRFAQFEASKGKSLSSLLEEFSALRASNLTELERMHIGEAELELEGTHPELGKVTLRQLLSSWVVHDLGHVSQIARVMAKQYKNEVGVWTAYLSILN
ncbi:MAG: hypothetical protein Tsb0034_19590 [Ekhidna sp.]